MIKIFASLLGHDLINIQNIFERTKFVTGYHLDMIDLNFAPNLGLGIDIVNTILNNTHKEIYIHLMVNNPELIVDKLDISKNKPIVAWHFETNKNQLLIDILSQLKIEKSLAVKATTLLDNYKKILHHVDRILLLTVEPGFSGGKFIENSFEIIKKIIEYREANNLSFKIDIDGGLDYKKFLELSLLQVDSITSSKFDLLEKVTKDLF
jgi:ribulose-phosphate 3-epimerase